MNSSQDTPIQTNMIIEAINNAVNGLRQEMNERFNNIEARLRLVEDRLTGVEERLTNLESDVHQIKEMQFVFENELDRLQAATYQSLNLAHESRADIRIMRKEIGAWSKDVRDLQRRAA